MLQVIIDRKAGFCFGVVRAIDQAEKLLLEGDKLNCLGQMVHNDEEVRRLEHLGMGVIKSDDFSHLSGKRVLIRAHGEPPSTYALAKKHNISLIDATCPIVLRLQERIAKEDTEEVQVLIFGKKTHPEVIGLNGQKDNRCIVIESIEDLGQIDFSKAIHLYSQTTMDAERFDIICEEISNRMMPYIEFKAFNTICGQMRQRKPNLREFVKDKDVVLFVAGKNSSNGKYLFSIAKQKNINTYLVGSINDIDSKWFKDGDKVGLSGATSTPSWLIEEIAAYLKNLKL